MFKLDFYTQYSQFYICDAQSQMNTGGSKFWTEEAHESRLAIAEGCLGIRTQCYGQVKGELKILEKENESTSFDFFDHVIEGGLEIKSGQLNVLDCPTSSVELEIPISNGHYRVRIYSSNLDSVEGDDGDDFYHIEIWKGQGQLRKLIKKYLRS